MSYVKGPFTGGQINVDRRVRFTKPVRFEGGGFGVGNVYYVIQSTNDAYTTFVDEYQGTYSDGSAIVYTTIAAALAVTVAERNDYVIVMPDNADYDITATLTMDKKCVHLICPAGLGYDVGANNSVRLHMATADTPIITLASGSASCEIAGFYFKNTASTAAAGATIYAESGGGYCSNIHNNHFAMVVSGGTNSPSIAQANDGLLYSTIHRNRFITTTGASATIAAVILVQGPATGVTVNSNDFVISNTCTATTVIDNEAVMGSIKFNTATACGAQAGGAGEGQITNAFAVATSGSCIGNMGAVKTATLISGGTASQSFCFNWDGITTTPEVIVD
jgi:hypothetical protein